MRCMRRLCEGFLKVLSAPSKFEILSYQFRGEGKLVTSMDNKRSVTCQHGAVVSATVISPIGKIVIHVCPNGVHCVEQENCTSNAYSPNSSSDVEIVDSGMMNSIKKGSYEMTHILECTAWLKDYFGNSCGRVTMPFPQLCFPVTDKVSFKENVWQTLAKEVHAGQTISYADLAAKAGNPRAARAVGSAMKDNPFQIIIPCHRVIRKDDSLGHYCGGTRDHVKKWLLLHESGSPDEN